MAGTQGCFKIQNLVNEIHHINKQKTKQNNIINLDTIV